MQRVSVRDYSDCTGINERTVRRYVKSGQLPSTKAKVNNRDITMVLVDDDFFSNNSVSPEMSRLQKEDQEIMSGQVEEAEIIEEAANYSLVSMDNNVFEQLIKEIRLLSDSRADSDRQSYKDLQAEYFELKTKLSGLEKENKNLSGQLQEEKIKSAQFEAEVKIKQLQSKEIESSFEVKDVKIKELEESLKQKDEQIKLLKSQLKESDANFWSKARKL